MWTEIETVCRVQGRVTEPRPPPQPVLEINLSKWVKVTFSWLELHISSRISCLSNEDPSRSLAPSVCSFGFDVFITIALAVQCYSEISGMRPNSVVGASLNETEASLTETRWSGAYRSSLQWNLKLTWLSFDRRYQIKSGTESQSYRCL